MNRTCGWRSGAVAAAIALTIGTAGPLTAQETGGAAGDWLSHYAGARTVGLGGAFVAAGDNAFGALRNPANMSQLYQNEGLFETSRLYESTSLNGISFAVPGHRLPSFGITVANLRSGDFARTNELNDDLGTFNESEMALLLTASKNINPRLAIGTNLKMVRQSVEDFSAGGFGVDLGGLYQVSPALRVAASFMNLGGPTVRRRATKKPSPCEIRGASAPPSCAARALRAGGVEKTGARALRRRGGGEYGTHPRSARPRGNAPSSPGAVSTPGISIP